MPLPRQRGERRALVPLHGPGPPQHTPRLQSLEPCRLSNPLCPRVNYPLPPSPRLPPFAHLLDPRLRLGAFPLPSSPHPSTPEACATRFLACILTYHIWGSGDAVRFRAACFRLWPWARRPTSRFWRDAGEFRPLHWAAVRYVNPPNDRAEHAQPQRSGTAVRTGHSRSSNLEATKAEGSQLTRHTSQLTPYTLQVTVHRARRAPRSVNCNL